MRLKRFLNIVSALILFMLLGFIQLSSQSSYHLVFGAIAGNNGNTLDDSVSVIPVKLNQFRNGYTLGINGVFGTYGFFISPGAYYKDYTISEEYSKLQPFVTAPRIKSIKAKTIIGYQAGFLNNKINFRFGGGLNYNYIVTINKNDLGVGFNTVNDNYLAYSFDLGFDLYFLTFGLGYESTFSEVIKPETKMQFLVFTAGIKI
jgi:hypothetical protein